MLNSRRKIAPMLIVLFALSAPPLWAQEKDKASDPAVEKKKALPAGAAVEVRLADDSTLKLQLREEKIELETAYGKLLIPVADIQRIDVGLRLSDELCKKIDAAIADLGNSDFRRREAASTQLTAWREKAYRLLSAATKNSEPERLRRIEEVMEKIRDAVPAETLDIPLHDVVHTADSKIAGRIKPDVLRVSTLAFGEQQVKLTDVRTLRSQGVASAETAADNTVLEPGALQQSANQVGKTLTFRVTGPQPGAALQMGVFGTDVYTMDSSLSAAAVHAGAVQPGKTGLVRVTILGPQPGFQGSLRNGIASHAYGAWPGFRIERPRGAGVR